MPDASKPRFFPDRHADLEDDLQTVFNEIDEFNIAIAAVREQRDKLQSEISEEATPSTADTGFITTFYAAAKKNTQVNLRETMQQEMYRLREEQEKVMNASLIKFHEKISDFDSVYRARLTSYRERAFVDKFFKLDTPEDISPGTEEANDDRQTHDMQPDNSWDKHTIDSEKGSFQESRDEIDIDKD